MSNNNYDNKPKLPSHIAFSVEKGHGDKNHWHRVGAAWPNKDGSLSLKLNAVPVDGRVNLQLREAVQRMQAKQDQGDEGQSQDNKHDPKP